MTGSLAMLVLLTLYAFAAAAIGEWLVPPDRKFLEAVYFMLAGLAWIVPAGLIIKWIFRSDHPGG